MPNTAPMNERGAQRFHESIAKAILTTLLPLNSADEMPIKFRHALFASIAVFATWLSSAPAVAADHIVYAVGDVAQCSGDPRESPAYRTAALVPSGATVLLVGDAVYPVGEREHFDRCFQPTWGRHRPTTLPVPGNHEYYAKDARGYFDYFGAAAGVNGYVSMDIGNWLVIGLNSNLKGDALDLQERWLSQILDKKSTGEKCILAFWHHPLFSSRRRGKDAEGMKGAWKLLEAHHADVLLNGHEHFYEAFAPQNIEGAADAAGLREFIVGTGGGELDDTDGHERAANSRVWLKTFGVLKLTLAERGYHWQFLVEGGKVLDSDSASCHR
jgi:hypothetical protein